MKLFKNIKNWLENQEHLFYLFLFILIVPNLVLCLTEPLPLMAKVCNVLLPFGCYYLLMTLSRNCGKMLWILFLFLFFGAFQIVLLYLFGQSIIAVDMFLNLVTTNSSEALELLDNLTPAIIAVIGKGHEDYQEINGVRHHFLDREVIEETIKELGDEIQYDRNNG